MEERLAQLEKAVATLQGENERLRQELEEAVAALKAQGEQLRAELALLTGGPADQAADEAASPSGLLKGRLRRRWPLIAVGLTVAVPLLALSVWHLDAAWSTVLAFLNGLFLYYIGPRAWALVIEGAFRAIPGVLFGQAARVAVEKFRSRRSDKSA